MALAGIFQILHTPFTDGGTIDWQSFANQIDYCMAAKVHGLVLPAMASEFFTLSDEERYDVVEFASTAIDGRVPLVVGVQAITLHLALKFAEHAIAHKADALMAMPPYLRKAAKPDVEAYYKALASLGVPLMIQNAPAPVGTPLGPAELASLLETVPNLCYIKEETPPILQRITKILDLAGPHCDGVFGGANGIYLVDELERGACGNMPAGGLVDVQVKIYDMYTAGQKAAAEALNHRLLPLLNYAAMYGASFHKFVLWRRGVLNSPHVRDPQRTDLDTGDIRAIEHLWPLIADECLPRYPYR